MRFDIEMLSYCGGRFRVQQRVERIISEQTGKMMRMQNPCLLLENVYCRAECSAKAPGLPAGDHFLLARDLAAPCRRGTNRDGSRAVTLSWRGRTR